MHGSKDEIKIKVASNFKIKKKKKKKKNALHLNIFSVINIQYKYCAYSMFRWVNMSQVILK